MACPATVVGRGSCLPLGRPAAVVGRGACLSLALASASMLGASMHAPRSGRDRVSLGASSAQKGGVGGGG
eukprot:10407573-Alexandrium_andersonii.AAC.1